MVQSNEADDRTVEVTVFEEDLGDHTDHIEGAVVHF